MSDDTPTERYDAAGDAPTERLTPAEAAIVDPAAADPEVVEERKSRRTMIILGSIGGALLVILIILLILLLVKPGGTVTPTGSPTPSPSGTASSSPTPTQSASATPTPTPTPTPTATVAPPPPPPSNDVEIDSFNATDEVDCSSQTQNPEFIEFSWSSTNGLVAYFAVGATNDAEQNGMGWTLPPNGSTSDFPSGYFPYEYQCGNQSMTFTITIVGSNGSRESDQVTVTNVGDTF